MNPEAFSAADSNAQITQLQQQQALITQSLKAMLEGKWTGEASVEALLYALDPNMQGTVTFDTPITMSKYEAEEPPKG